MPKFTALVYTRAEDEPYLQRALESLRVANDVLLINGDRTPEIRSMARHYSARERIGVPGVTPGAYLMDAFHHWILVLRPFEELSNDLIRSLQEWKRRKKDETHGYLLGVLQQNGNGWNPVSQELRLVNRHHVNWMGELPPKMNAPVLPGPILRYERDTEEQRLVS